MKHLVVKAYLHYEKDVADAMQEMIQILCYVEGFNTREIAELPDVSEDFFVDVSVN